MSTKFGLEMSRKIFKNDIWLPILWSFSNANAQKSVEALYSAGANWSVFYTHRWNDIPFIFEVFSTDEFFAFIT